MKYRYVTFFYYYVMLFFFCSLFIIFLLIIPLPKNSLDYDPTKGILSKTEGSRRGIERCRTPCLISQKKETEFTLFILFDGDFLIRNREYREKKIIRMVLFTIQSYVTKERKTHSWDFYFNSDKLNNYLIITNQIFKIIN